VGDVHVPASHPLGEDTLRDKTGCVGPGEFTDRFSRLVSQGLVRCKDATIGIGKEEDVIGGIQEDAGGRFADPERVFHGMLVQCHLDGGLEFQFPERLEDIPEGLGELGFCQVRVIAVGREVDHRDAELPFDLFCCLDSVHLPCKHDIHQDQVRVQF